MIKWIQTSRWSIQNSLSDLVFDEAHGLVGVQQLLFLYRRVNFRQRNMARFSFEGTYKATWKKELKLPWRETGPPNHLHDKGRGVRPCRQILKPSGGKGIWSSTKRTALSECSSFSFSIALFKLHRFFQVFWLRSWPPGQNRRVARFCPHGASNIPKNVFGKLISRKVKELQ